MADSHLGFRQYGSLRREQDFEDAFKDTVTNAVNGCKADVLIHSGDILDSTRPSPSAIQCLQGVNEWLNDRKVFMFVISGNHDLSKPHWMDAIPKHQGGGIRLLHNELAPTELCGGLRIYGRTWEPQAEFIRRRDEIPECDIVLWHGALQEFDVHTPGMSHGMIPLEKCQVWAAGDLHINRKIRIGDKLVGYPGSTELTQKSHDPEKSFTLLQFDAKTKKLTGHVDVPIKTRPVRKVWMRDDMAQNIAALDTIKNEFADSHARHPIVYVTFKTNTLPGLRDEVFKRLDPTKFIIREDNDFDMTADGQSVTPVSADAKPVTVADVLNERYALDHPLHGLLTKLTDPDQRPDEALRAFVEQECSV